MAQVRFRLFSTVVFLIGEAPHPPFGLDSQSSHRQRRSDRGLFEWFAPISFALQFAVPLRELFQLQDSRFPSFISTEAFCG